MPAFQNRAFNAHLKRLTERTQIRVLQISELFIFYG